MPNKETFFNTCLGAAIHNKYKTPVFAISVNTAIYVG